MSWAVADFGAGCGVSPDTTLARAVGPATVGDNAGLSTVACGRVIKTNAITNSAISPAPINHAVDGTRRPDRAGAAAGAIFYGAGTVGGGGSIGRRVGAACGASIGLAGFCIPIALCA